MSAQRLLHSKSILLIIFITLSSFVHAGVLERTFTWNYNGKNFSNTFHFSSDTYNYYKKVKRNYTDFTVYMDESKSYPVISDIAAVLKAMAQKNKFNDAQTVEFIAAFVQFIGYKDDGYYEYPRFPVETLVEKAGDCEDTAILLAAILQYLGYNSVLLSPRGHMGVGVAVKEKITGSSFPYNGCNYFYIETTSAGWGIGDYPDKLSNAVTIYDPGQNANARPVTMQGTTDYSTTAQNSSSNKTNNSANSNSTKTTAQTDTNKAKPDTKTSTANTSTEKQAGTKTTPASSQNNTTADHYTANYTIEEDVMIINGEKETMVTRAKYNGEDFEVVAVSK